MLKHLTILLGLLAGSLAMTVPTWAHHSFAAEFDASKLVHLQGVVVKFDWVNPHSWLYIDVTKSDGTVEQWKIEGGAPSALLRRGWNRNSLPAGTKVVVNAYPARDGARRASPREIIFPDGRSLDLGSSYQSQSAKEKAEAAQP